MPPIPLGVFSAMRSANASLRENAEDRVMLILHAVLARSAGLACPRSPM